MMLRGVGGFERDGKEVKSSGMVVKEEWLFFR